MSLSPEQQKANREKLASGVIGTIAVVLGICAVVYVGQLVYSGIDDAGYLTHSIMTQITFGPNWMVGETRSCYAPSQYGNATSVVVCDTNGETKTFKVTFHGREQQNEYRFVQWSCTRNEIGFVNPDAFTCKQIGGTRW